MEVIEIPRPEFGSHLSDVILKLEKLRAPVLHGTVPAAVFFQLKSVFHMLETLGSARIEGNNTTLADYVEAKLSDQETVSDPRKELDNIEAAISFIEETVDAETPINRAFISELHKMITKDLVPPPSGEGSRNPGELRVIDVSISGSGHTPPNTMVLEEHYEALLQLLGGDHPVSLQLLAVALAHHRFAHIHPFDNGNGRVGRVLSYALLLKSGFNVKKGGRIINPSAVFYTDRDEYYRYLSAADSLQDETLLEWSEYYLDGLLDAIQKVDRLLSLQYIQKKVLSPALSQALEYQRISKKDYQILVYLISKEGMAIKSEELSKFGYDTSKQKSNAISRMKNADLIIPTKPGGRIYTIKILGKGILRDVIEILKKDGFIAASLENNH